MASFYDLDHFEKKLCYHITLIKWFHFQLFEVD